MHMQKRLMTLLLILTLATYGVGGVQAQSIDLENPATATPTAATATPSATIDTLIQAKKDSDITESSEKQLGKLASYLRETDPGELSWYNFLQHSIRYAVSQGVPANIIVLVLLFPLIASFIAASRHIIGLRGFGIYIPAVLSVALVSTGILAGTIFFAAIVAAAMITKKLLKKAKLSYLPRTALLIWTISLGLLILLLTAPFLNLTNLMSVNIFPILILVLLAENFLDAQTTTKPADALALTVETLGLAFLSGLVLRWETMQKFALLQPELLILATAALNVVIGKFSGLRLSEFLRFRAIIEEEE
jgi:hypothetical protein